MAGASGEVVLTVEGLAKHFGGLKALDGVDIAVRRGTVHALIGPNGSGKSTFINVLTGLYRPTAGRIAFAGPTSPACRRTSAPAPGWPARSRTSACSAA